MAKLTLTDLTSLENQPSAILTINNNSQAIETAMDNTLSRDGTSPNEMDASLDMNSHRILNLPKAASAQEPLRLQELSDFIGGTISFPSDAINVSYNNAGTTIAATNVQDAITELDAELDVPTGTAGGIPYYSTTTALTSTTALTQNGVVLGGGASASPFSTSAGTNGQLLIAATTAAPAWVSASGDVTITAGGVTTIGTNSVGNTKFRQGAGLSVVGVTGTATANVADITSTANQVLRTNSGGTALGFGAVNIASSAAVTGQLALTNGGLNASLTASAGGIFYSTASAGAILAGTTASSQVLLSGSTTAPVWSSATYPNSSTVNQILYSSATNTITGLATATRGVLVTNSSGVPSISTSGQIPGSATNDSASAGNIGEYINSTVVGPIPLTTAVTSTITSISLTPGDWDVETNATFSGAATTTAVVLAASLSTASGTLDFAPGKYAAQNPAGTPFASNNLVAFDTGRARFSLSTTATVFMVCHAQFGVSSASAYGIIHARRVR